MKVMHLYEVKMLDGAQYCGEIAHKDTQKIVLRLKQKSPVQKLRLFNSGILSVKELGWHKAYALR